MREIVNWEFILIWIFKWWFIYDLYKDCTIVLDYKYFECKSFDYSEADLDSNEMIQICWLKRYVECDQIPSFNSFRSERWSGNEFIGTAYSYFQLSTFNEIFLNQKTVF